MAHAILIALYVVGAVAEILGIFLTARSFVRDNKNGTAAWVVPTGWKARLGPGLIVLGITVGLAGNIASLYLTAGPTPPSAIDDDWC